MNPGEHIPLDLRPLRPREPRPAGRARTVRPIPSDVLRAAGKLAGNAGTDLFTVFVTALAATLSRYTGQFAVPISVSAAGSGQLALIDATDDPAFGALVAGVSAAATEPWQDVEPALRQVSAHEAGAEEPDDVSALRVVFDVEEGPEIRLDYDTSAFDERGADAFGGHLLTLLAGGVAAPDTALSTLPLLTDAELAVMLDEGNETAQDLPHDRCLHEHFAAQATRTPDAVVLIHPGGKLTFGEADRASDRLAHRLRALGVGPDTIVGICLAKSPELLIGLLGILKAGGAYLPLDVEYPTARLAFMMTNSSCRVLVTTGELASRLPEGPDHVVEIDREPAETEAAVPLPATATPENLCYIIYTSGSTGTPKGIALRHRGVVNNLQDLITRFGIGPGDVVLGLSSPSFDMSVPELLGVTLAGGTIVLPDPERAKDPRHWAELMTEHRVTIWNSAPALLEMLIGSIEFRGGPSLPAVRLAMLGGDWVPLEQPARLRALAPDVRVIVMGGASEASVHSTIHEVTEIRPEWRSIPYGVPMANQTTYILDPAGQPVPVGVPGELHLGGIGLARGYLGLPEVTAAKFVAWEGPGGRSARLLRTGDLARFTHDGTTELLGRIDFQVKINGLRIELGEVEARLRAHPSVAEAVVVARSANGAKYLAGYVLPGEGTPDTGELTDFLLAGLPRAMVPSKLVVLPEFPLSPNGKVDRKALP